MKLAIPTFLLCLLAACSVIQPRPRDHKDAMAIGELQYAKPSRTLVHPIEWTHERGFMIKWRSDESPEFFVYTRTPPNIQHFVELNLFLSRLSEFPRGSQLDWVNTCCCPISCGMSKDARSRLDEVITINLFSLLTSGEGGTLVCTCESTNVVWFTKSKQEDANKTIERRP